MNVPGTIWSHLRGVEFTQRYRQVGEWRMRCIEAGRGPSTVILLHGTGGHAEAFSRNVAVLAEEHHVVVPDLPGHGFTTLTSRDLEIQDYVDAVSALIEDLGVASVHLQGESLGGWIGARLAAQQPQRVERLILNTPGGSMLPAETMATIRNLTQAAVDDPTIETVRRRLEWLMADSASVTDELVEVRQAIYRQAGFSKSTAHILCLQDPVVRQRNLLGDGELASIKSETLVVWTTHNPTGAVAEGERIARVVPHARLAVIDDAGHWPQWEQAEQFNALIVDFLRIGLRQHG
jgi:2-hydroxy-6-oxonona-2,4-dienedioate hydrolase